MSKDGHKSQHSELAKETSSVSSARKTHHLDFARAAQTQLTQMNSLFSYEPLTSAFPDLDNLHIGDHPVAGKSLKAPVWISSMTGGTGKARHINQNLAKAAGEFGLGLGLGSCRSLLYSDEFFNDFHLRPVAGDDACLFANFGVAQVDQLLEEKKFDKLIEVCKRLEVDGLFIHINPLQEFFQPEGDHWSRPALEIVKEALDKLAGTGLFLGVKEVGQGMGPESLKALMDFPLEIIEFGAFGGTNFSYLEAMRNNESKAELQELKSDNGQEILRHDLRFVGHSAMEMVSEINRLYNCQRDSGKLVEALPVIIASGGVRSYLDGFTLVSKLQIPGLYGMAMPFLAHATGEYSELAQFVRDELRGLKMAQAFLRPKF